MEVKIPETVNIVELEKAPFKCAREAIVYAKSHGIVGIMSATDSGGKGEVSISIRSLDKMLSGTAVRKSVTPAIHFSALVRLRDIIRESFVNVEVLRGNAECAIQPSDKTSTCDVGILLNGVCDVNGAPLLVAGAR